MSTGSDGRLRVTDDGDSVAEAVGRLSRFVTAWSAPVPGRKVKQNEHALDSRVLRGKCPVMVGDVLLSLLQPADGVTNWGSQFPTRWGHRSGNAARHLDAMLRDGDVPWAIEMKIAGASGVGRYYRHAIGQAVLYRHFIRHAEAMTPWFERQHLAREKVHAGVLIPSLDSHPLGGEWRRRLSQLCDLFDVALIEVDPSHASLR